MAQPWPLVGGHLLSALIGVTCADLSPTPAGQCGCHCAVDRLHAVAALPASAGRGDALIATIGGAKLQAPVTLSCWRQSA